MKTTSIIQSNIHRILSADSQIITWYTYNLDKFSIRLTSIYSKRRDLFSWPTENLTLSEKKLVLNLKLIWFLHHSIFKWYKSAGTLYHLSVLFASIYPSPTGKVISTQQLNHLWLYKPTSKSHLYTVAEMEFFSPP